MKKDASIQLTYASVYIQIFELWTMEKIIDAFEITGCKHNMASDQPWKMEKLIDAFEITSCKHNMAKDQ